MILPLRTVLDKSHSHLDLLIAAGELFRNVINITDLLMDGAASVRYQSTRE